ncbi:hypothetical protein Agub_g15955, partial [Astrephomene gubernaculifera]
RKQQAPSPERLPLIQAGVDDAEAPMELADGAELATAAEAAAAADPVAPDAEMEAVVDPALEVDYDAAEPAPKKPRLSSPSKDRTAPAAAAAAAAAAAVAAGINTPAARRVANGGPQTCNASTSPLQLFAAAASAGDGSASGVLGGAGTSPAGLAPPASATAADLVQHQSCCTQPSAAAAAAAAAAADVATSGSPAGVPMGRSPPLSTAGVVPSLAPASSPPVPTDL